MKTLVLILTLTASLLTSTRGQQSLTTQRSAERTKKVCIVGNVVNQREILFDKSLTVTAAIEQAGGIRTDKTDNDVIVISRTLTIAERATRVGDWRNQVAVTHTVTQVDLKAIKEKPYMDLLLQDLDVIEVLPRKPNRLRDASVYPCAWAPGFKGRM
jgi:protein involved in polysaccharide export with SLBB domain